MHRSGTTRLKRAAKAALIFCSGTLLGLASAHVLHHAELRADAAELVPVHGVEGVPEKAPDGPEPARAEAPVKTPEKELGSRLVARAAYASTVAIRGDGVYGAGIVISADHVLTCLHVVEKMKAIHITTPEGTTMGANVVDRDPKLDLAVLKLEEPRKAHARLASIASLEMGDPVFAMGAPRKLTFSLTSGIVSYAGRPYSDLFYLQNDIPTNGGSSGGPILDEDGRVVGVSSFILRDSQGLAFALPIDYAYQRFPEFFVESLSVPDFVGWLGSRNRDALADERPPFAD